MIDIYSEFYLMKIFLVSCLHKNHRVVKNKGENLRRKLQTISVIEQQKNNSH